MKKNCNGCRALQMVHGTLGMTYCDLGYQTTCAKKIQGITVETKPLELCPKPTTYDAYFSEKNTMIYGKEK